MGRLVPPFYLGPYKVVRQLGAGGFATVFRAAVEGDMGFSRDVALKVLHPHITRDSPEVVAMLADEARLLARMQHPNIVYVQWFGKLDHPEDGEVFAMMMEYVEGRTFGSMLHEAKKTDSPLPLSVIVDVHIAVAKALAFAHSLKDEQRQPLGLVHRDLKPENVMVSRQGAIKLLDFGIAKATDRLAEATATDLVRGTVHYMSPEQVRGTKDLDFRSDLFSLGGMLYESVLGTRLISADSIVAAIHQVASFDPDPAIQALDGVNPALGAMARRLLAVDRDERYSRTSDLVLELEEARRSVQAAQTTETWLADRFMAVGDTAAVPTPRALSLPHDAVSETVDLPSGDSHPPTSVPPTRPQARVSGSRPPFSSGAVRCEVADPLAPTAAIPSDQAILATLGREQEADEPRRRRGALLWLAVPAILAVGIALGVLGPRWLGDRPNEVVDGPVDPGEASTSPAATAAPHDAEVVEDEEVVLAALEDEDEDRGRDGEKVEVPAPEVPAEPPPRKGSDHPRTATADARPAPGVTRGGEVAVLPSSEPTPTAAVADPPAAPGVARLAADQPFEVSIGGKVYSKLQARQGIELPAGTWPARFTCLQCPEGVATTLTVQVVVAAGETATRIVQFPAESR